MDSIASPILYISLLLVLLSSAVFFVARQVLKTRRVESAFTRLQNKLSKEKGTAEEYYELGSILLDKRLFTQAIAQYQKAIKLETLEGQDLAAVYNAMGFAYFAQEQYDLAIRQYKEALKLLPEYVTALNNLGHAYERKQLAAPALEIYEQALELEPTNQTAKRRADALRKRLVPSA
ncbi:tetratricopeptide repeat protein [Cyanobacteria bacterium FACHB-DQ100]|uniref:tetratricopeptide repeat protein n=1 Tax=unclassified Leptolyngbya TaxID=2650499 RepID=UPI0016808353|nr:tetratricopeptide repeat protein [Leptolyngbya sp. FACHB-17]MBD1821035.1 tetratricopeptide repeat protein [Cyanobacteria bacterium FACHB-DQ100]MBD2079479.1 tetratricopeptide repeat protein [Leptolyngbya sp. FACHB-17]